MQAVAATSVFAFIVHAWDNAELTGAEPRIAEALAVAASARAAADLDRVIP
jgi:hypothetical protein